ncbi:YaiO family outer membrane beta-barrel protein [Telluria mixta]|uniref:YaiO family outer membrane beta-barrel protein n=1 Tax=Telluria mixta TaxID=34071 RepID=A0ABT2C7I0_9BURK|nr:YaiO family outer membrane beta-barrel protein [Telluria mixta]MCS0633314.1 YaiO family outer membrane beta-barrel protein [Telluria mixta]WEM94794.1 YaiO family outer membrane beta-barrel protein [Telluria mixta]
MPVAAQLPPSPPSVSAPAQPAATPSFDDAYARARALANDGQPELALAAYDALLARSPGNVDVLLGRGIVYARLGRWQEAERDLRAAAAASPTYADVWSALGNTYAWSDQPDQAVDAYTRLIALQPDDAASYVARGRALRALGRNAEARADLDKATALGASGDAFDALAAALQPRAGNPDATIAAGYTWAASLSSSWTDVGAGPRWNDQTASIRHYTKRGSLAFETLRAHRFGRHDYAWALDGYANLWSGAYANLRYQRGAAARLFPANSGRAELYQSLGNGWEASVSDDVLGFASRVNIYGVGIAKYTGDWYVQLRHQNIVSAGSHGTGERLLARWYYAGDADTYAEVTVNSGRSDDPLSLVGGQGRSGGGSATWVRYWTPNWGTRVGASFSRASGADNQRGLTFSLYRRW